MGKIILETKKRKKIVRKFDENEKNRLFDN